MRILRNLDIKKYFDYDDTLRKIVSKITGLFIIIFNVLSGFMIIHILGQWLFEIINPGTYVLLLYIIPGTLAGAGLLYMIIIIINLLLGNVEIEEYSYLRLVLFTSVAFYIVVFILYSFVALSQFILIKKIFQ